MFTGYWVWAGVSDCECSLFAEVGVFGVVRPLVSWWRFLGIVFVKVLVAVWGSRGFMF